MSICDPYGTGVDICAEFGNSTIGHIDCATGWSDVADYGELDAGGCDAGCGLCLDYPSEIQRHADYRDGNRWLRPSGATRDAMGRRHDLRTAEPWPLPDGAVYEYAPCYHNTTGEACFNRNVCAHPGSDRECWRGGLRYIWAGDDLNCPDGTSVGEAIPAWFPDVAFYGRNDWKPAMSCRRFEQMPAQRTTLGLNRRYRLFSPALPRFQGVPYEYDAFRTPCGPNVLIPCSARFRSSTCLSGFANRPEPPDPGLQHWMVDPTCRAMWAYLYCDLTGIGIAAGPTRALAAAAGLKNAALAFVASRALPWPPLGVRFDRLDYRVDEAGAGVSLWRREWNIGAGGVRYCGILADPDTILARLTGERAGERVDVLAHVFAVSVSAELILHRVATYVSAIEPYRYEIEPHVRLIVRVELAYTIQGEPWADDCWTPPAGLRIRTEGGQIFRPPHAVEWLGYLGHLGIGGMARTPYYVEGTLEMACFSAADGLGTLVVPGWPDRARIEDPPAAWPYTGSVRLWFETRAGGGGEPLYCQ